MATENYSGIHPKALTFKDLKRAVNILENHAVSKEETKKNCYLTDENGKRLTVLIAEEDALHVACMINAGDTSYLLEPLQS